MTSRGGWKISATFKDPKDAVIVVLITSLLHQLSPGRWQWIPMNTTETGFQWRLPERVVSLLEQLGKASGHSQGLGDAFFSTANAKRSRNSLHLPGMNSNIHL